MNFIQKTVHNLNQRLNLKKKLKIKYINDDSILKTDSSFFFFN